jgi:hypothetical protein
VRHFRSLYLPHTVSYLACWCWDKYSTWSEGQLPAIYGISAWHANWKKTTYSNDKLKQRLDGRSGFYKRRFAEILRRLP